MTSESVTNILNTIIGSILVLTVGFFIMEFVLAAISLATGFEGSKKTYEASIKRLTGALKGIGIALLAFFLLNTILKVFGINTDAESITKTLGNYFINLFGCLKDFSKCK